MLLNFISFRTKFCSLVFFRDSLSGNILQMIQQDSFENSPLLWSAHPSVVRLKCHSLRASSPFGDIVKSRRARDTREETQKRDPSSLVRSRVTRFARPSRRTWSQAKSVITRKLALSISTCMYEKYNFSWYSSLTNRQQFLTGLYSYVLYTGNNAMIFKT